MYEFMPGGEFKEVVSEERKEVKKKGVLKEFLDLTSFRLAQHKTYHSCAGSDGEPCLYSNGPCACCVPAYGLGGCPFGEGFQKLDDEYVNSRLERLRQANVSGKVMQEVEADIASAKRIIKSEMEAENSAIKAEYEAKN